MNQSAGEGIGVCSSDGQELVPTPRRAITAKSVGIRWEQHRRR